MIALVVALLAILAAGGAIIVAVAFAGLAQDLAQRLAVATGAFQQERAAHSARIERLPHRVPCPTEGAEPLTGRELAAWQEIVEAESC